ncbi:MAG: hypothetical protein H7222_00210 [Methylotenera sp.]|nr:hypothetical protein [Oligoflexia bacterium]
MNSTLQFHTANFALKSIRALWLGAGVLVVLLSPLHVFAETTEAGTPNAAVAKETPLSPLEMTVETPRQDTVKIQITAGSPGRANLHYDKLEQSSWTRTNTEISRALAEELTNVLVEGKLPYSKWQPDTNCFRQKTWVVRIGDVRQKVCSRKAEVQVARDFQNAVQMALLPH